MRILVLNYDNNKPELIEESNDAFSKKDCEVINEDIGIHVKVISFVNKVSTIALYCEKDEYTHQDIINAIESLKKYVRHNLNNITNGYTANILLCSRANNIIKNLDKFIVDYKTLHGIKDSKLYLIGLLCGGLMEMPGFEYHDLDLIEAVDEIEATILYNKKHECEYFYGSCILEIPYDKKEEVQKIIDNHHGPSYKIAQFLQLIMCKGDN